MNICFITGAFPKMKCGVGDYTFCLSREIAKLGHDVSVITHINADSNIDNNIRVFNIVKEWKYTYLKVILRKIKEISPDVVVIQYPSTEFGKNLMINFLPGIIKKKQKCQVVETIHEYTIYTIKGRIRQLINLRSADKIVCVEKQYEDEIKKYIKLDDNKFKFIPISSNIPRSTLSLEEKVKLRDKMNLSKINVISFFGFATHVKGIESLFKCMKQLDNTKLLFINKLDEKNDYQRGLINLIDELNIKDKVIVTGFIDSPETVADYLSISDVCVLPFVEGVEDKNGSFLAAYNQKIPVITTSNTRKNKDGIYYVKTNDDEELLNTIKNVLSNKTTIKRDELSWTETAKSYISIFD